MSAVILQLSLGESTGVALERRGVRLVLFIPDPSLVLPIGRR
jgi:hypothetical protein